MRFIFLAILPALVCSASQFRTFVANPSDSVGDASACADVSVNDGASCNIRSAVQWCVSTAVAEGDECTISIQAGLSATIDASLGEISVTSSQMSLIIEGGKSNLAPSDGFGVRFLNLTGSLSLNVTIFDLVIQDFYSSEDGAAISVFGGPHLKLVRVTFTNNTCNFGCGLLAVDSGQIVVHNCTFRSNHAFSAGSGLRVYTELTRIPSLTITNCIFDENLGSAVAVSGLVIDISIANSSFTKNTIGSDFYSGAAVALSMIDYKATIKHCNFTENYSAGSGGAIFVQYSWSILLESCSFYGNEATYYGGAAMIRDSEEITLRNCLFYSNTAVLEGGAASLFQYNIHVYIDSSHFESNKASKGGAICLSQYNLNVFVRNSTFIANLGDVGVLTAVERNYLIYVEDSIFSENSVKNCGTYCAASGNQLLYIYNSKFFRNRGEHGKELLVRIVFRFYFFLNPILLLSCFRCSYKFNSGEHRFYY
jgi:predicted outer membrane repeat protein